MKRVEKKLISIRINYINRVWNNYIIIEQKYLHTWKLNGEAWFADEEITVKL